MSTVASNPENYTSPLIGRAFLRQPFCRKEEGDASILISRSGTIYKLEGVLGAGGLSTVYLATRYTDGKTVALKVHCSSNPGSANLLRREAAIISRLDHPNIIKVIEAGETSSGDPFIAMELLRGQTLDQLLIANGGHLPLKRAANICLQVAEALEHAHGRGILHRDIKPSNVLIVSIDGEDRVTVFDFGIASDCNLAPDPDSDEDSSGSLLYASPEQLSVDGGTTERSDVYQLALVLFESLTGRLPFEISVEGAIRYRQGSMPVLLDDSELGDLALTRSIRLLLESALSLDPDGRPCTMNLFAHELRNALMKQRVAALIQDASWPIAV